MAVLPGRWESAAEAHACPPVLTADTVITRNGANARLGLRVERGRQEMKAVWRGLLQTEDGVWIHASSSRLGEDGFTGLAHSTFSFLWVQQ